MAISGSLVHNADVCRAIRKILLCWQSVWLSPANNRVRAHLPALRISPGSNDSIGRVATFISAPPCIQYTSRNVFSVVLVHKGNINSCIYSENGMPVAPTGPVHFILRKDFVVLLEWKALIADVPKLWGVPHRRGRGVDWKFKYLHMSFAAVTHLAEGVCFEFGSIQVFILEWYINSIIIIIIIIIIDKNILQKEAEKN
jgi:hypothetical protein